MARRMGGPRAKACRGNLASTPVSKPMTPVTRNRTGMKRRRPV